MPHPLTERLLDARASGELIATLADDVVPTSVMQAYEIHAQTLEAIGPVGAWKVQPFPSEGEPLASPLPASVVLPDAPSLKTAAFPGLEIEAEIAFRLGRDLPSQAGGYTSESVRDAIASIHLALEIVSSRFVNRATAPKLAGLADLQSNGAVIVGAGIDAAELPEFGSQAISLSYDGEVVATTSGNATTDNAVKALAWLADHAAGRGIPLKAGDIIITGARIGPLPFSGREVVAEAKGLGSASSSFT